MQLFLFQVKHSVHTVYVPLYRRLKIKFKDHAQFQNIFVSQYVPYLSMEMDMRTSQLPRVHT